MLGHRRLGGALDAFGIARAALLPLPKRPSLRQVAVDGIVRRGLVGDDVGPDAAAHELGQDFGGIAEERDRHGLALARRPCDDRERVVEVLRRDVDVAGAQPEIDRRGAAFDREARGAGHRRGERLRAAHAAEAGGENPSSPEIAAVVPAAHLDEGLVGALHDALRADVDPRARGHLAVHHEALAIELVEAVPGRPVRHEVGVGDQHPRRVGVGAEHADRLARLDEQRLVALEAPQRRNDAVERLPIARRPPDPAVDHELARPLGDVGIEVVHQHAHRRLGQPALGAELGSARRADDAHIVDAGGDGHRLSSGNFSSAAGSGDGLQALPLDDGEQAECGAAWTLHAALPIRHQIARDVEVGGEHRL